VRVRSVGEGLGSGGKMAEEAQAAPTNPETTRATDAVGSGGP